MVEEQHLQNENFSRTEKESRVESPPSPNSFLFTSFIRIHWYTVPPTFQFTVWEDGFDYIVFLQMGILNMIQHFMHKY